MKDLIIILEVKPKDLMIILEVKPTLQRGCNHDIAGRLFVLEAAAPFTSYVLLVPRSLSMSQQNLLSHF